MRKLRDSFGKIAGQFRKSCEKVKEQLRKSCWPFMDMLYNYCEINYKRKLALEEFYINQGFHCIFIILKIELFCSNLSYQSVNCQ